MTTLQTCDERDKRAEIQNVVSWVFFFLSFVPFLVWFLVTIIPPLKAYVRTFLPLVVRYKGLFAWLTFAVLMIISIGTRIKCFQTSIEDCDGEYNDI